MADSNQNELARQYEELICKLPGVIHSSVIFSNQDISEIHVLADTRRSPKQIARDIESAIAAQYGVIVDHKVISIAQIPTVNQPKLRGRLIFDEINISKNKERSTAAVTLTNGEASYSGSASSLNDSLEVNKMICQATLAAVENFLEEAVQLSVADVKTFDLGGQEAVAVCVAAKSGSRIDRLIGSAFIGDDSGIAVVKAALDALNRKITTV